MSLDQDQKRKSEGQEFEGLKSLVNLHTKTLQLFAKESQLSMFRVQLVAYTDANRDSQVQCSCAATGTTGAESLTSPQIFYIDKRGYDLNNFENWLEQVFYRHWQGDWSVEIRYRVVV